MEMVDDVCNGWGEGWWEVGEEVYGVWVGIKNWDDVLRMEIESGCSCCRDGWVCWLVFGY